MQSAVLSFTIRDQRGSPLEICRAFVSCAFLMQCCLLIIADQLLSVSESWQIPTVFADSHTRNAMHTRNTLNSQSAVYNTLSLVPESEGIPP